jgi:hypothetical protein
LRTLLGGAFDYSGLFPPAQLDLPAVVANYRSYRRSPDAWALGRLVVPAGRLPELAGLLEVEPVAGESLAVSAVLGPDVGEGLRKIMEFNREARVATVEAIEVKGTSEQGIAELLARLPSGWPRYVEIPLGEAGVGMLGALQRGRAFAKIRTGGLTQEAFPPADQLLEFLQRAVALALPFKATAGLHHPLRGTYRLTYEERPPRGVMYGYLNLMLAAALAWSGGERADVEAALLEERSASLRADADGLDWRGRRFDRGALAELRADFFHGIGSCSFREPMDELAAGGWG